MVNLDRRQALGLAATVPLVAGCGSGTQMAPKPDPATSSSAPNPGQSLAATGDVPVGGGLIVESQQLVLSQPAKGEFKAFTNICTHQQCPITRLDGPVLICPCHGSRFDVTDGSVVGGVAKEPLAEIPIKVTGDSITLA